MKCFLTILFCILFLLNAQSQTRETSGDTVSYNNTKKILADLQIRDLLKAENEFSFLIQYNCQVIEIWKDKGVVNGALTNYIFKLGKKPRTVFKKEILSDSLAMETYQLIRNSSILDFRPREKARERTNMCYETLYMIEYADENDYKFKIYEAPFSKDSLEEATVLRRFITEVDTLLDLKKSYANFKEASIRNGCYSTGGMFVVCSRLNNYHVGYTGSSKLPLGYTASANIGYVGDHNTNVSFAVTHQFDAHDNYDFSTSVAKWDLFIRNRKRMNDYFLYTYRERRHNEVKRGTKFRNHTIVYGVNMNATSVVMGANFLNGEESKIGASVSIDQYISKPRISILGETAIYKGQFDYKIKLSRSFRTDFLASMTSVYTSLYYENFAEHGNIGCSLSFLF